MKQKTMYVCSECGFEQIKWVGKCPGCSQWNTMGEFKTGGKNNLDRQKLDRQKPVNINDVSIDEEIRFSSGISELDRVLGGGAVMASFVLVGGEPGIGKSTLLLQMCEEMCKHRKILYVSGEESLRQIKLRASRLNFSSDNLYILSETDIEEVLLQCDNLAPNVVIIDSIQTMYRRDVQATPGNTTQIKESAMLLMQYAKNKDVTIFIIGHVNKDGNLAGPKILEHMVDCVLYFEGEKHISYRMLRAAKNRFGSTNEIGIFDMSGKGLIEITNPSAAMLSGHNPSASGSCISCIIEGTRPILTEIQALVTKSSTAVPRRTSAGIDYNRFVLMLAILEKRVGLYLSSSDAYINVVGGINLDEPAVDLPMVLSIASSYKDKPIRNGLFAFGEIGLTGELRSVYSSEQRINEAIRLGFKTCIMPNQDIRDISIPDDMEIIKVQNIFEAINKAF